MSKNANLNETEKKTGAWREAFQSRPRSLQRQRPTRERRSPSQERPLRQKKRSTRPKEPLRWQRLESPQRQRTQTTEWNTNMHRDGRRPTHTYDRRINFERNDVRRNRQVISEGNAPMMRRKFALACITREMLHFRSQCLYGNGDQCMQTERGAIRKSTVRTKPTTSSTDRTTLPRGEWTRGADGVCTHNRQ